MDSPETDRVFAEEMKGLLKELRDKNTKLTDEKEAAESKVMWLAIIAIAVVFAFIALGGGDGHHYHRY